MQYVWHLKCRTYLILTACLASLFSDAMQYGDTTVNRLHLPLEKRVTKEIHHSFNACSGPSAELQPCFMYSFSIVIPTYPQFAKCNYWNLDFNLGQRGTHPTYPKLIDITNCHRLLFSWYISISFPSLLLYERHTGTTLLGIITVALGPLDED